MTTDDDYRSTAAETEVPADEPAYSSYGAGTNEAVVDTGRKHVTDRFVGSLGLLALRLTVAAVMGVHGVQKFQHLDATKQFFASTAIFAPSAMATVTAIGEILVAIGLVVGVAVASPVSAPCSSRAGALVYVKWTGPIFSSKVDGFSGDIELLLVGAGLALLALGGGAWGWIGGSGVGTSAERQRCAPDGARH